MLLSIIATILIGIILYDVIYRKFFSPLRHLPEAWSWPLLHHTPYLFFNKKGEFDVLSKFAKQFEETGIFKYGALHNPKDMAVVLKPEYQKKILCNPDSFIRAGVVAKFFPLATYGLLNSKGDAHRLQKKLLAKAFSSIQIKHYIPVSNKHTSVLIEKWKSVTQDSKDGQNLAIQEYFVDMTFDIIGEVAFGYHFNSQTTERTKLVKAMRSVLTGCLSKNAMMLVEIFPFLKSLLGYDKIIENTNGICKEVFDEILAERKKKTVIGDLNETEKNDLLSKMMEAVDEDTQSGFTDQEMKDNIFTFLFAGHETTATGIPGVLYYLAKYPDLQEKVREEIFQITAGNEDITFDHLTSIPYTSAFIKESLRLFGPVPMMQRISLVDSTFGEYTFPKGTVFMFPNFLVNKDENAFEEASKFIPERFLEESGYKNGTMFTFGYGPYNCIGKTFALQEIKVAIVRLMQKFKFSLDPGCDDLNFEVRITLKTDVPMMIRVKTL